jgi:hypothetical protein
MAGPIPAARTESAGERHRQRCCGHVEAHLRWSRDRPLGKRPAGVARSGSPDGGVDRRRPRTRPRRALRRLAERPVGCARASGDRAATLARRRRRDPGPARGVARRPAADARAAARYRRRDTASDRSLPSESRVPTRPRRSTRRRRLDLERSRTLDDDEARDELTQVKGVGRFTADGVLMLALRRADVWPAADLALRRAVERVWALDTPASVAQVDALGERFRPWRTLAATYLYRTLTA